MDLFTSPAELGDDMPSQKKVGIICQGFVAPKEFGVYNEHSINECTLRCPSTWQCISKKRVVMKPCILLELHLLCNIFGPLVGCRHGHIMPVAFAVVVPQVSLLVSQFFVSAGFSS